MLKHLKGWGSAFWLALAILLIAVPIATAVEMRRDRNTFQVQPETGPAQTCHNEAYLVMRGRKTGELVVAERHTHHTGKVALFMVFSDGSGGLFARDSGGEFYCAGIVLSPPQAAFIMSQSRALKDDGKLEILSLHKQGD